MEVSAKAWRAYGKARTMLLKCSIEEVGKVLSVHVIPKETQEALIKEKPAGLFANYLAWEALETMEGLLELMIAVQTLKNEGTITVRKDEPEVPGPI